MTDTMAAEPKVCVTGVDPEATFNVPWVRGDFQGASDLERIGVALIASCPEFEDLRWATQGDDPEAEDDAEHPFDRVTIGYHWRKKAGKSADRSKAGTLAKTGGKIKFLSGCQYLVEIAADINRFATNWQMEALVYHELYHIKIARKALKRGDESEETRFVPDLKVRAHDLEMFFPEMERYGLWRADLKKAQPLFAQAPLFQPVDRSTGEIDSSVKATVTFNGKTVDLDDHAAATELVGEAVGNAVKAANRRGAGAAPKASHVDFDQSQALQAAGAQSPV